MHGSSKVILYFIYKFSNKNKNYIYYIIGEKLLKIKGFFDAFCLFVFFKYIKLKN